MSTSLMGCGPISVIIPTLNEGANIAHLLVRLDRTLMQAGLVYEAIVVDDHSTDDTVAIAAAVARDKNLPVRVLTKQGRPGKSFSLIEGFVAAQFDVLAMIDGDLQYPPEVLPGMVHQLAHADIVVADRRSSYSDTSRSRGALSGGFTFIVGMLFGIDTDMQSGLKVFRRKVYESTAPDPSRWSFDLHLVTKAVYQGHLVANVPITYEQRQGGASKVGPLAVGVELMMVALRLKMALTAHKVMSSFSNQGKKPTQDKPFPQSNAVPETPPVDTTSVEHAMLSAGWLASDAKGMDIEREKTNAYSEDALKTVAWMRETLEIKSIEPIRVPALSSAKYLSLRRPKRYTLVPLQVSLSASSLQAESYVKEGEANTRTEGQLIHDSHTHLQYIAGWNTSY